MGFTSHRVAHMGSSLALRVASPASRVSPPLASPAPPLLRPSAPQHWPFFQSLMDLIEMVMAKGDMRIASLYDQILVEDGAVSRGSAARDRHKGRAPAAAARV